MYDVTQLEDEDSFAVKVEDLCSKLSLSYTRAKTQRDFEVLVRSEDEHSKLYILDANFPIIPGMNPRFMLLEAYTVIGLFHGEVPILVYTGDPDSPTLKNFVERYPLIEKDIIQKTNDTHYLETRIKEKLNL